MFGSFAGDGHPTITEHGQLHEQANVFAKQAVEDIESLAHWADMPEVFIVLRCRAPLLFLEEGRLEDIQFSRIPIIKYDVGYLHVAHLSVHIPPPDSLQDGVIEKEQEVEVVGDEETQVLSQEPAEFDLDEWFRFPFAYKHCRATESGQAPRFGDNAKSIAGAANN